jgi:hypothetical protein
MLEGQHDLQASAMLWGRTHINLETFFEITLNFFQDYFFWKVFPYLDKFKKYLESD